MEDDDDDTVPLAADAAGDLSGAAQPAATSVPHTGKQVEFRALGGKKPRHYVKQKPAEYVTAKVCCAVCVLTVCVIVRAATCWGVYASTRRPHSPNPHCNATPPSHAPPLQTVVLGGVRQVAQVLLEGAGRRSVASTGFPLALRTEWGPTALPVHCGLPSMLPPPVPLVLCEVVCCCCCNHRLKAAPSGSFKKQEDRAKLQAELAPVHRAQVAGQLLGAFARTCVQLEAPVPSLQAAGELLLRYLEQFQEAVAALLANSADISAGRW